MARVVFQDQIPVKSFPANPQSRIKLGGQRSLTLSEETNAMTSCLPYKKPSHRHEPKRLEQAVEDLTIQVSYIYIEQKYKMHIV